MTDLLTFLATLVRRASTHVVVALALALFCDPAASQINWLSKLGKVARHADDGPGGSGGLSHIGRQLDDSVRHLKSLPEPRDGHIALAAELTPEGQWRFANRAGETFTVANEAELAQVASVLAPGAPAAGRFGLSLYLTEDVLFAQVQPMLSLPAGARLHVVLKGRAFPVVARGSGAEMRRFVALRRHVLVEVGERRRFEETVWQLRRPLNRANVRVLSLDESGPKSLGAVGRRDRATGRLRADLVDPRVLPAAIASLRGQIVVITGRVEERTLIAKSATGEHGVSLDALARAAEAADVNLVILKSASARQPDTRNWLWRKAEVEGLDKALQKTELRDFFDTLGRAQGELAVTSSPRGAMRTVIEAKPIARGSGTGETGWTESVLDLVSDITANVVTTDIEIDVTSRDRQEELDSRFFKSIPSSWQFGYLGLLVIGLFGAPVAWRWWARVWPGERPGEYGRKLGYWAARAVRGAAFGLIFMPLVAIASAPIQALLKLWQLLVGTWYVVTWPFRRRLER